MGASFDTATVTQRSLPVRGNRSEAVTATGGDRRQKGGEEKVLMSKQETDVGLCLGNGRWVTLVAWFKMRRKRRMEEG